MGVWFVFSMYSETRHNATPLTINGIVVKIDGFILVSRLHAPSETAFILKIVSSQTKVEPHAGALTPHYKCDPFRNCL